MTPTRILHVYKNFQPHTGGGGVPRHMAGLADLALQEGHSIRVIAEDADPDAGEGRYEVHHASKANLLADIGWADIVHVHGSRTPISLRAAYMAHRLNKKIVYTPHCYYDHDSSIGKRAAKWLWDQLGERWLLKRADATVLLAEFWLDYLQARNLRVTRPVFIPNCVLLKSLPQDTRGTELKGSPALLSVGRLDCVKRLEDAISALTQPGLEQAVLHLVGTGPDRARLEQLVARKGLNERVQFHGFVSDSDVAGMSAAADAFLLPSEMEGMPTVIIEMLLHRCPVVASDIPGNRAILAQVGLEDALYPLADVSRLGQGIVQQSRNRISDEHHRRTINTFTWEGIRQRVKTLYENVSAR
ncbi:glycosyltransferase involved in cell wall biosynthesis [Ectopseudomonas oleovorans]|uniref:Glycosyltransferase involved in cell wall biosynthesis n=1 Tax=Ectopseudomonas oleovorans TaxID=301 RepID=A0A397MEX7_ECTOL|nr:glycosyltransferase family 4 protein [Pseudomonas oleovorans]RIA22229.1 glycosyltransferase involved in cell wall biosynthesis [Pseudomonas oleovorans]